MILPLLDRPVAVVAQPRSTLYDYISPSRLNLWLKCPLAFKLRYVDAVKSPPSPALYLGKLVHAGLERYYRLRQVSVELPEEEFCGELPSLWQQTEPEDRAAVANVADLAELDQQATGLVRTYLQQVPRDEGRPTAVELTLRAPLIDPVTGENLGIDLLGVLDLVLPGDGGPLIVDFKTAARGGEVLEITHEVQLTGYAYLFRQVIGHHESGLEVRSLIKTKTPRVERHRWSARTAQHFGRLFAIVRAYLDDLDRQRFVCRPSQACSYCEHRETRCRAWAG